MTIVFSIAQGMSENEGAAAYQLPSNGAST